MDLRFFWNVGMSCSLRRVGPAHENFFGKGISKKFPDTLNHQLRQTLSIPEFFLKASGPVQIFQILTKKKAKIKENLLQFRQFYPFLEDLGRIFSNFKKNAMVDGHHELKNTSV